MVEQHSTYRKKKLNQQKIMQTARAMLKLYNSAEQSGSLPAWRLVGDHYSLYTLYMLWVAHTDHEMYTRTPSASSFLQVRFLQGS